MPCFSKFCTRARISSAEYLSFMEKALVCREPFFAASNNALASITRAPLVSFAASSGLVMSTSLPSISCHCTRRNISSCSASASACVSAASDDRQTLLSLLEDQLMTFTGPLTPSSIMEQCTKPMMKPPVLPRSARFANAASLQATSTKSSSFSAHSW